MAKILKIKRTLHLVFFTIAMISFFQQWCQSFPSFWQCPSATGHPRFGCNIQCRSYCETVKSQRILIRLRSVSHGPKELAFLDGITGSGFTIPQKQVHFSVMDSVGIFIIKLGSRSKFWLPICNPGIMDFYSSKSTLWKIHYLKEFYRVSVKYLFSFLLCAKHSHHNSSL